MAKIGYFNNVTSDTGNPTIASITVYLAGTETKATIYADAGGTIIKDNPFITDVLGRFQFFAAAGAFDISVSGTGITTYKIENIQLSDITRSTQLTDMPGSLEGQALKGLRVNTGETAYEHCTNPPAHASSHQSGGDDAVKLDDLAAPDNNTDLNASTTNHGLLLKATAPAANVLNVVGIANGETNYANKTLFNATNPAALGTAAPGTSLSAAHRDHVHTLPKLDALAAPEDNADLDASTAKHGLRSKIFNIKAKARRIGDWSPSDGWNKTPLTTEDFDTGSDFDPVTNYRFTADKAGYYLVLFDTGVYNNSGGSRDFFIAVYKNGTQIINGDRIGAFPTGKYWAGTGGGAIELAVNDYLELYFYVDTAANVTLNNAALSIVYLDF